MNIKRDKCSCGTVNKVKKTKTWVGTMWHYVCKKCGTRVVIR